MLASTNHGDLGEQSTHLHVVLEWAHKARRRKMTEGTMPSSRQQGENSQFGHQQSFHHFLSLQFLPERLRTETESRWQNSKIKPQKSQGQTCWSCHPDSFLLVVLDFLCQGPSGPPTFASMTTTWNCLATFWLPPPDGEFLRGQTVYTSFASEPPEPSTGAGAQQPLRNGLLCDWDDVQRLGFCKSSFPLVSYALSPTIPSYVLISKTELGWAALRDCF